MKKIIFILTFIILFLPNSNPVFSLYTHRLTYNQIQEHVKSAIEFIKSNDFNKALRYLLFINDNLANLENPPIKKSNLYELIATAYYKQKQFNEALKFYELTLENTTDPKPAFKMIITILVNQNQFERAYQTAKRFENLLGESLDDYFYRASIYSMLKDYHKTLSYYEYILLLDSNNGPAILGCANSYIELNDFISAQRLLNRLLLKYPKNEAVLNIFAITFFKQKMYQKALTIFNEIIKINSSYWPAYYNLACVYSLLGNKDNSFNYFKKSVEYGFRDFDKAKSDKDLSLIIHTTEFKELIKKIENQ